MNFTLEIPTGLSVFLRTQEGRNPATVPGLLISQLLHCLQWISPPPHP